MPFQIVRNDITKMKVDAVINTANPNAMYGRGTDQAIYEAAGRDKLLAARQKIGTLQVGEAVVTPGFRLPAKYIIHNAGPVWEGGDRGEEEKLELCYENCLRLAAKKKFKSIAFPLISTGTYGFPKKIGLQTAIKVLSRFLLDSDMMIYLVVFDDESVQLSEMIFPDIPDFIQQDRDCSHIPIEYPAQALFRSESLPMVCEETAYRTLDDIVENRGKNLPETLMQFLIEKDLKNTDVYHNANISRKVFSKIITNEKYHPKKKTVLALAIGMRLNLDETKDLLSRAGYALSPGNKFDLIVKYCIEIGEYNIVKINILLYEYGEETLGD